MHISAILEKEQERIMTNRKARQLPIIDIGGTGFYLDLRQHCFRQVDNWSNQIAVNDVHETGNGQYRFWFDTTQKRVFAESPEAFAHNKNVIEVILPSLEELDPLGYTWMMEERGLISFNDARIKTALLLKEYHVHENGMILQRKAETKLLLPKKKRRQSSKRRKRL